MSRVQLINHKGKQIFYMDFTGITNIDEIKGTVAESVAYIRKLPPSSLLTLTNISGMHFSNDIKQIFQDFIAGNKPYVKAGAVIGMSGLQQIVYNGLMKLTGRNIKSCSSIDEAKDWLVTNS